MSEVTAEKDKRFETWNLRRTYGSKRKINSCLSSNFFSNVSNTKFSELFYRTLILFNIFKSLCKININTREIKHRVFGKRQTANVNMCHVTKFSIYLSFTVYYIYAKIGRFTPILSITIVLSWFHLLISHFEHFSTWISRLPFGVNAMLNLSQWGSLRS